MDQNKKIIEDLEKNISQTGSLESRAFEKSCTEKATTTSIEDIHAYREAINEKKLNYKTQFYSYCVVFTYERRRKNSRECHALYEQYKEKFSKEILFSHMYAIILKEDQLASSLEKAHAILSGIIAQSRENAGIMHNYCELQILRCEKKLLGSATSEPFISALIEAGDLLDDCIEKEPDYAKFYATKSRLLMLENRIEGAERLLKKAITLENPERNDYPIRINDYSMHLQRITTLRYMHEFEEKRTIFANNLEYRLTENEKEAERRLDAALSRKIEEMQGHIDDTKNSNIEFLGFFAAIITFTLGSFQLVGGKSFLESAQLIFILVSGLIIAFSGLTLLVHRRPQIHKSLFLFLLGAAVFFFSIKLVPLTL